MSDPNSRKIVDQTEIHVDFDDVESAADTSGSGYLSAWIISKSKFEKLDVTSVGELPGPRRRGVLWIDCADYEDVDLREIGNWLDLDNRGVEAALTEWSRPGIESFDTHALVSATALDANVDSKKISACELDIFIGDRFIVTAHRSPVALVQSVVTRVETDAVQIVTDPAYLLYILLDELIDSYNKLADELDGMIQPLEDQALSGASENFLTELVRCKQFVYTIGRLFNQHSAILHGVLRPDFPFVAGADVHQSFMGLNSRFITVSDMLNGCRQEVLSTFEIHMSRTAEQTNATVKTLTMISVFVLPASAIFGFFGANFVHLPFFGTPGFRLWRRLSCSSAKDGSDNTSELNSASVRD